MQSVKISGYPNIILLVNPIAGGKKAFREAPRVKAKLIQAGWKVRTVVPRSAALTTEYVSKLPAGSIVGALGGDGLLARVCEGAVKSGAWVLPLPSGRGNDMCRALGMLLNPETLASQSASYKPHKIDVGEANGKVFLGAVSIGYDALICQRANAFKYLSGAAVYAIAAAIEIFRLKQPFEFLTAARHQQDSKKAWMLTVSNSGVYGGGMKICPESNLQDGKLEMVSLHMPRKGIFLKALKDVFSGKILDHPGVSWERITSVKINSSEPMVVYADGDYVGQTPVKIRVLSKALTVLLPENSKIEPV